MSNSIYTKKLKEALLGDRETREIGEFVLFRDQNAAGVGVFTKDVYEIKLRAGEKGEKNNTLLRERQKADKETLKDWNPKSISDDELDAISLPG